VCVFEAGTTRRIGCRIVDSGSGYDSQNDMPVHFGLAVMEPVDVEVVWPANGTPVTATVSGVSGQTGAVVMRVK
jgi:hypothetical protein